jgi:hypothetical protein
MEAADPSGLGLCNGLGEAPVFIRDDVYEERQTAGSGIALFATAPIASGTRLFCEAPAMVLSDEARQPEVFQAVMALSERDQLAFWKLAASSKPSRDVVWIDDLRRSCRGMLE